MQVHQFRGVSSPSCSGFALCKTTAENKDNISADALGDKDVAVDLVHDVHDLFSKGGLWLTKWLTNSKKVAKTIPECERAKSLNNLDFKGTAIERALGLNWNVCSDTLQFRVKVKEKSPTQHGIQSLVSSVYDHLGFAGPFLLPAKTLLKDLYRMKLRWYDAIPVESLKCWQQ